MQRSFYYMRWILQKSGYAFSFPYLHQRKITTSNREAWQGTVHRVTKVWTYITEAPQHTGACNVFSFHFQYLY